jgi:hypothetical protein
MVSSFDFQYEIPVNYAEYDTDIPKYLFTNQYLLAMLKWMR